MDDFNEALRTYCKQAGVSPFSVFLFCHDEKHRALSAYEKWLNKGFKDEAVQSFLLENDPQLNLFLSD